MAGLTRRALIGGLAGLPLAARGGEARRVLFVGNSFTYEHDLPGMVARIAAASGCALTVLTRAEGGASLAQHAAQPGLAQDLAWFRPDWIVLQDFSTEPLTEAGRIRSTRAVAEILAETAARPVFFATWPRRAGHSLYRTPGMPAGPAAMAALVEVHYAALAETHQGRLAPAGRAWITALARGLAPHRGDDYHANASGAWLAALTLARAMGHDLSRATPPETIPNATQLRWIAEGTLPAK
ncbi:MAG: hypothetical protein AAFR17_05560 [Pseudomonadota bacterium]